MSSLSSAERQKDSTEVRPAVISSNQVISGHYSDVVAAAAPDLPDESLNWPPVWLRLFQLLLKPGSLSIFSSSRQICKNDNGVNHTFNPKRSQLIS